MMKHEFLKEKAESLKKKALPVVTGAALAVSSCVPVLASDAGASSTTLTSVETALDGTFTAVGNSMINMVTKVLPVALPVMGALVLVNFGIKAFKSVTNKA